MSRSSGSRGRGGQTVATANAPSPTLLLGQKIIPDLSEMFGFQFFKGFEKSVLLYEISNF